MKLISAIQRASHSISGFLDVQRLDVQHNGKVTQAEAHILARLADRGEGTVGQIHSEFGYKRSTMTSILNRLEARGLITCNVSKSDRRSFLIGLTPLGETMGKEIHERLVQLEEEVLGSFPPADQKNALRLLAAVTKSAVGALYSASD